MSRARATIEAVGQETEIYEDFFLVAWVPDDPRGIRESLHIDNLTYMQAIELLAHVAEFLVKMAKELRRHERS